MRKKLQPYYEQHANDFKQVASVDVDFIVVTPANIAPANATVTEAELQQAYQKFVETQKGAAVPTVKRYFNHHGCT